MAARILTPLVAALALLGGGYWWGHTATDNAWAARQAKTDETAAAALQKETARADAAGGNYLREHLDQEDRYAVLAHTFEDVRRRVPLVVARPLAAVAGCNATGAAPAPADAHSQALGAGVDSPGLTFAAVRMWNGALTGTDQGAGACDPAGAAAGADAACAQDSGLDLGDAWDNHAANAKACAADRQRYQHLIDFLTRK
ncbi:MAG: hypothetical protein PHU77_00535 [Simplicispira sp.]|nr:hypothetical protein [Simplicispira sp.]